MICPYRKTIVHQPEIRDGERIRFRRDVEEFSKCHGAECPFFVKYGNGEEGCKKARKEEENGKI